VPARRRGEEEEEEEEREREIARRLKESASATLQLSGIVLAFTTPRSAD
jgi:hypothetical protein